MKFIKDLGMRYPKETSKHKSRYGLFECECGTMIETILIRKTESRSISCKSCSNTRMFTKHGESGTRLYGIWTNMKQRCYEKSSVSYAYYGQDGVEICDEWLNDYPKFSSWAKSNGYDETLQIDRVDNNLGYSPSNCRWATKEEQSQNTRLLKVGNKTGYRGVSVNKSNGRFIASIGVNKKTKHLGYFDKAEEAANAYDMYVIENNLMHTINNEGLRYE